MNKKALLFVYLCVNFSLSLLAQNQSKFQAFEINDKLVTNADAVIRLDEMSYKLISQSEILIKRNQIITVLNETGVKHVNAFVNLDKHIQINELEAFVYDSKGNEIKKFKQKNFVEDKILKGTDLYSDQKLLKVNDFGTSYPYTIHFKYEIKTTNTAFIPKYYFINDYGVSIEEASCRINFNANELNVTQKENGFDGNDIKRYTVKGNATYSIMNFEALTPESLSPSFESLAPSVQFSSSKFNFDTLKGDAITSGKTGLWYYNNILSKNNNVSQEAKSIVEKLVSNATNSLEKTKLIHEYVKNNFEYVKLDAGFGNYIPLSALKVDEIKKGDSKSLINYTRVLLNQVGIESYFTFVHSGVEKSNIDDNFASLTQANHAILCVPINEELYWIDYSSDSKPFNFIGGSIDNRKVLVIKPTGGEIITTPTYSEEANYKDTYAQCYIANNGDIKGSVVIKSSGVEYCKRLPFTSGTENLVAKKYEEEWKYIEDIAVEDFSFVKDAGELTENINVSGSSYATVMSNMMMFSMNIFNKDFYALEQYSNRKTPIIIQRSVLQNDKIIVHVPNGYKVRAIPSDKVIENKYGKFKAHFEKGKITGLFIKENYL